MSRRDALATAHSHAEDFHCAMWRALEAERELEDTDLSGDDRAYWEKSYTEALGSAVKALQRMPAKWAAILHAELDALSPAQQTTEAPVMAE